MIGALCTTYMTSCENVACLLPSDSCNGQDKGNYYSENTTSGKTNTIGVYGAYLKYEVSTI